MTGSKVSVLVMLLMLGTSQSCPSCDQLCSRRRIGCHPGRTCQQSVSCNVTGSNCSNQELSSCLADGVDVLYLTGHYDNKGTLNPLPALPMLDKLTLGGGNIRDIKNGTFATFSSLSLLSLNGNSIQKVGIWFEGLEVMERLHMYRNKIENIERGAFRSLKKLQILDLSCNRIRSIEAWYFEGLSRLLVLKLEHNGISRVAASAFDLVKSIKLSNNMLQTLSPEWLQNVPPRANVHLDSNLLPTITKETLDAIRGKFVVAYNNPFRCTCALNSLKTEGMTILERSERLYCSYPPYLKGKKISQMSKEDMPCPPPVAKVSRADNGTTLLCEVYWEQQPDISWVGPEGSNISASTNTSGNGMTTHLKHEVSPDGHSLTFGTECSSKPAECSTLNFMGKSTYKLLMSQKVLQEWAEGAYRCSITYPVGNFSVKLVLSLTNSRENDSISLRDDGEEENHPSTDLSPVGAITTTEKMPMEYVLLPQGQHLKDSCILHLIYTGIIAVSVSLLVGVMFGWLISLKRSNDPNTLAMRELPPLPLDRRSSQLSLHHYEVIPDNVATSLHARDKNNLNKHKRRAKQTEIFHNPQYEEGNVKQRREKHTEGFLNPQYGEDNVKQRREKHTDVFYNPQYGQGNRRRRWSTPLVASYNDRLPMSTNQSSPCFDEGAKQIQDLTVLGRDLQSAGDKKSPTPLAHPYMLPQTQTEFKESPGYEKDGSD